MIILHKNARDFCPPDITKLRIEEPDLAVTNVAAEQGLLGSILFAPDGFDAISAIVGADDFAWLSIASTGSLPITG
jgi:hypothetical protein